MTQKDGSPEASEGPYWSEELLAVLVVGLGDETRAGSPEGPTATLPATARELLASNGSNEPNEPSKRHHHVYIALNWLT